MQLGMDIGCVERQIASLGQVLKDLRDKRGRFLAGGLGERKVVRVLIDMVDTGWTVLADRRWPGTRRANIDVLLAGPGGVFVVDVKTWRDVRIEAGQLWRGDAPADDAVAKLRDQTDAVREVLAQEGLPPSEVVPLLVLTGRRGTRAQLGDMQLLGELDLSLDLLRRGTRLTADQVECVVARLETACPSASSENGADVAASHDRRPSRRLPTPMASPEAAPALLDAEEVWAGLVEAAAAEPIEAWMTWLHPSQSRLIARTWSGPARIRGAAGTGKTVVALHRARHLARQGRHVLFASYVNSLGPVFAGLFTRLAPALGDQVEFASVHQIAMRLLASTGRRITIDKPGIDTCFHRAWAATRHDGVLDAIGQTPRYWQDEIAHVIKGRGITAWTDYVDLTRVGRRTPLQPGQREAVWRLFEAYQNLLADKGLLDWDDVLLEALDAVEAGAVESRWDAVIVDEVQDLTGVGLKLLHALVGNAPDALLLVGDGQQAIYPGGYTLAETGISVTGRAVVLDRNYRNGADILRHALAQLGQDTFDDLDAAPAEADRTVHTTRRRGEVLEAITEDPASQEIALLARLDELAQARDARYGDIAILVPTNAAARRWHDVLEHTGLPSILLTDYDGRTVEAVKIGTFQRSKGLDFAHVLIPDRNRVPGPRHTRESDAAHQERAILERRRLFVAMTRARDTLWLGTCTAT
jgi:hypothetical protein